MKHHVVSESEFYCNTTNEIALDLFCWFRFMKIKFLLTNNYDKSFWWLTD